MCRCACVVDALACLSFSIYALKAHFLGILYYPLLPVLMGDLCGPLSEWASDLFFKLTVFTSPSDTETTGRTTPRGYELNWACSSRILNKSPALMSLAQSNHFFRALGDDTYYLSHKLQAIQVR